MEVVLTIQPRFAYSSVIIHVDRWYTSMNTVPGPVLADLCVLELSCF